MASLSLKSVTKKYSNGFVAVKELDLETADRELIIFVGPSGCGKSTTFHIIAGLEDISPGELHIDDKLVNGVEPKDRDIAMISQNYALYPRTSVCGNMAFRLKLRKTPKDKIDEKVHNVAEILSLERLLGRKPKALSGSQRQHVAMGCVIIRNPEVFLMDEPLSNLDAKLRDQMRVEISKFYQRLETATIYVTHDQARAMTLGTRIVVMKDGITQQVDNPQNLYDRPCNKFVVRFAGAPQMGITDATTGKDDALITLSFGGYAVVLSEAKSKKLEDAGYIEKVVALGIRPESPHDEESYPAISPKSIPEATVHAYEMLGSEVLLYFGTEDANSVTKVNPCTTARPGDTTKLAVDLEKIHIFDKDVELVVLN